MSTRIEILNFRLPARLAELDVFIKLAPALEAHLRGELELKIASKTSHISNAEPLLAVIADGAVIIARTLLQFLGLAYQKPTATSASNLRAMDWKADDIKITDLGLPAVTPSAAIYGWTESQQHAEKLLKLVFETGDKVSAHFTTKSAVTQNAAIPALIDAFDLVVRLVNREVYQRSSLQNIHFNLGSNHGHISWS